VTDVAGTTRDTLSETLVLGGLTVHLTDTAGLRSTDDKVEQIGITKAREAINGADVLLLVYDVSGETEPLELAKQLFAKEFHDDFSDVIAKKLLLVANKSDLLNVPRETLSTLDSQGISVQSVAVSCQTGQGIDVLIQTLQDIVGFHPPENSLIARSRHVDALKRAKTYAQEAHEQLTVYQAGELVAESLRLSAQSLGEITGQVSSDDLLGRIFSSFCIGK
jgi:tRNA modification GTPase